MATYVVMVVGQNTYRVEVNASSYQDAEEKAVLTVDCDIKERPSKRLRVEYLLP